MVLYFRKLNEIRIGDSYPLHNIHDILDSLGSAKYFSVFDLATSFHHIKMEPKDSHKTAFAIHHGHYEFYRMPFGLNTLGRSEEVLGGYKGVTKTYSRIHQKVCLLRTNN